MSEISETMKSDSPVLTEAEMAEVGLAGMLMGKQEHNLLLDGVLKEIANVHELTRGPRLILLGSVNNNIELIKFIDSLGGQVVMMTTAPATVITRRKSCRKKTDWPLSRKD